jgi:hypothetical protein
VFALYFWFYFLLLVFFFFWQIGRRDGSKFRTESLFLQPEDDAVVKLSESVADGLYDKLVSQFVEFEMSRVLRNRYVRQALIRSMDDVLRSSGLRMGALVEGARGSGSIVLPELT